MGRPISRIAAQADSGAHRVFGLFAVQAHHRSRLSQAGRSQAIADRALPHQEAQRPQLEPHTMFTTTSLVDPILFESVAFPSGRSHCLQIKGGQRRVVDRTRQRSPPPVRGTQTADVRLTARLPAGARALNECPINLPAWPTQSRIRPGPHHGRCQLTGRQPIDAFGLVTIKLSGSAAMTLAVDGTLSHRWGLHDRISAINCSGRNGACHRHSTDGLRRRTGHPA